MRLRSLLAIPALAALGFASLSAMPREARACGGCFSPPGENPTVVTDHKMILSVSPQQTTLYDQIEYTGSPSSFAWVLPISGTVDVGLSSDLLFQALDGLTQTSILPPPLNCPAAPSCNNGTAFDAPEANAGSSGGSSSGGVTVTQVQTVGPYETVQLKATDSMSLETWLSQNGFTIPADVQPVVDEYVNEKFDFLALKLIPGASVQDMRPVRVTTQGASAVLPLRMVSAGTGSVVGISLWVVGEGRYEPQNFPFFHIENSELAWDWTNSKSNYTELRATKEAALNGTGWEIESSISFPQSNLTNAVEYGYYNGTGIAQPADGAYLPVTDAQGDITQTADQVRDADLAAVFANITDGSTRVTRMRSDLAHTALTADLVITASADQSALSNSRQLTNEINEPQCPVYDGCTQTGTAPRSEAAALDSQNNHESFSCSTAPSTRSPTSPTGLGSLGFGGGILALSILKASRRRRKP